MARLSAPPPRLSRCRTVRPLLAGIGLVPPRAANAASPRQRPGWGKLTMAWAALAGGREAAGQARSDVLDDGQYLGAVVLAPGRA
jgi:hypothetical protein